MTAEEYAMENMHGADLNEIESALIEFAKLKCQELLKIVVENALVQERSAYLELTPCKSINKGLTVIEVNKKSILNAVDLDEFIK